VPAVIARPGPLLSPGRQTAQTYRDGLFKIAHLQANCLFRVIRVDLAVRQPLPVYSLTADVWMNIVFRR
jgi:hypothetical protein